MLYCSTHTYINVYRVCEGESDPSVMKQPALLKVKLRNFLQCTEGCQMNTVFVRVDGFDFAIDSSIAPFHLQTRANRWYYRIHI